MCNIRSPTSKTRILSMIIQGNIDLHDRVVIVSDLKPLWSLLDGVEKILAHDFAILPILQREISSDITPRCYTQRIVAAYPRRSQGRG